MIFFFYLLEGMEAWALTYPPGGQDSEGSLCELEDVQP